ncbi:MAG: hypothetical protein ACR2M1_08400 [Gemmatimonadaceae bacterium]
MPAKWPDDERAPVHLAFYGEAPGRYGADRSLCPFWGDKAAKVLYRALREAGVADWEGGREVLDLFGIELIERGLMPHVTGIMLSNAYDRCPAASPTRIRPPSRAEVQSPENRARVTAELQIAHERGCRNIVALGKVAGSVLGDVIAESFGDPNAFIIRVRPHPSALGLMQSNRHRAPGYKLAELEDDWVATTVGVVLDALAWVHVPDAAPVDPEP